MNPAWGHVAGVITLILFATFIGIWIWAWRKRHRKTFDAMSRLPMQDSANDGSDAPIGATDTARSADAGSAGGTGRHREREARRPSP